MSEKDKGLTRRDFLKTSGIATGTLIGGGLLGGLIGYNANKQTESARKESKGKDKSSPKGLQFFKNYNDFDVLSQATERIFPQDDLGPGAIELGVPYFIDNQLAGSYGLNAREYMQGPFDIGEATQGYQSPLNRQEAFLLGLRMMEKEAQNRYKKGFASLESKQMDEILTDFQKGEVKMDGITSDFFFKLLRSATLEGAYSDPIYGGNNNMDGWKMKNFPGHQAAYINVVDSDKFQKINPKSLATMDH
ncbi:oxidoreductase [Siminovitchia terrae]|uniref:Gluconate 2-dehydrogenase subunit 3 family protein n=1 Tax=Siminovitchia terrae TaxID=1914933 RepID=A0A429X6W3_SIMTE|nr:gluconate 2-dehydrogenase subunit 3 family protein [Siminovitchia terrae]RST59144.1 gluconate 2-dehydrogenase subunit 3 family protein [Siminovitchia terrae]GIN90289.1 oxidoreductase [Siminovitchia terrae]GIN94201.1 oxidoreductase [Siminovitchia terrae]